MHSIIPLKLLLKSQFLILLFESQICTSTNVPTRLLVTRVGPCYDVDPGVIRISEMKLAIKKRDSTLSGVLNITQDIEEGWIVKARMQKCHDIRNQDTCDHFKQSILVHSGCTDDEEESQDKELINMFMQHVRPELNCPIKAGTYNIKDFPFFSHVDLTAAESKISTSVFGYSFRLEAFDSNEDDRLTCVDAYIRMLYVRNHNWLTRDIIDTEITTTPVTGVETDKPSEPANNDDDDDEE